VRALVLSLSVQLWNAAKYMSGIPVLLLSAFEHEAHAADRPFAYRSAWLLACGFNSLFSFYWDVEHDWKMPWLSNTWAGMSQSRKRLLLCREAGNGATGACAGASCELTAANALNFISSALPSLLLLFFTSTL